MRQNLKEERIFQNPVLECAVELRKKGLILELSIIIIVIRILIIVTNEFRYIRILI